MVATTAVLRRGTDYYGIVMYEGENGISFHRRYEKIDVSCSDCKKDIGEYVLKALHTYQPLDELPDPNECLSSVKKLGFKSIAFLERNALLVPVSKRDDMYFVQPSIRRGSRRPSFDFLEPIRLTSGSPQDLGHAVFESFSLCR